MLRSGVLVAMLTLATGVSVASVLIGPLGTLSPLTADAVDARILREIRLPRVSLAFVAGAALATAGMAFRALFRNALATPYTLGVSAGASLGPPST